MSNRNVTVRIRLDGPSLREVTDRQWRPAAVALESGTNVLAWTSTNQATVRGLLADYGAVRLRGGETNAQEFGRTVAVIADAPLQEYVNRSTPRSRVQGQVFTSTEYRADQAIHMHSEQSYATAWPAYLGFWCAVAATGGGETPLASNAQIASRLPGDLLARFQAHGVRYDRWFRPGLDVAWTEVFQTDSAARVDELCAEAGITAEWHDGGKTLHTVQIAQATRRAADGTALWFNQANLFHPAALPDDIATVMRHLPAEQLPRNASFGDGSPISGTDIATINSTFDTFSWAEPWEQGDLLLIDNTAVAHGRRPFTGRREILVAMAGTMQ